MTEEAASALEPGSPFWAPLKAGWVRELVYRASIGQGNTKADAYYKAPKHAGGKKYRSLKEMERAIEEGKPGFEGLSLANFSFRRDPLKVNDPSMELIRGADPSAKIPNKRHSDVAESPPAKKPKKASPMTGVLPKQAPLPTVRPPWPLLPTVAPPRPLLPTVAPPRPLLPKMVPRPALSGHPQTAIRSRLVFPTIVPKPTQAGARPMGFAGGIRPVPANFLKGKVQTAKPTEEIVCEPAIYEQNPGQLSDGTDRHREPTCAAVDIECNVSAKNSAFCDYVDTEQCNEDVDREHEDDDSDVGRQKNKVEPAEEKRFFSAPADSSVDKCDFRDSASNLVERCLCGMCAVPAAKEKIVCCASGNDLAQVKSRHRCITKHPAFNNLVLDVNALNVLRHLVLLKTKNAIKKKLLDSQVPPNIIWRYISYKQFVAWVNASLHVGEQKRVAIPSCVVHAVRVQFPEPHGKYRVLRFT